MNLIKSFDDLFHAWNEEEKCGLCWNFVPGGRSDYFNNIKPSSDEACCVWIGILDINVSGGFSTNVYGTIRTHNDHRFKMIVGRPSRLDIQFYNENKKYDEATGKWERYINPILCCLDGGSAIQLCDITNCQNEGVTVEPISWSSRVVMNYSDYNIDGIEITAVLREYDA